jgi:AcrR family transcriptional regulator
MSPRKPAVLRGDGGDAGDAGGARDLREYLIATAARLIGERGSAGLAVRDIAREAQVADGVLYNYFDDKDDLLAHALLAHVASVMADRAPTPRAGEGTVADNLRAFIKDGLETLVRVAPAFAGLVSQPGVLARFHAMVGGDAAFGADMPAEGGRPAGPDGGRGQPGGPRADGQQGLPDILRGYLAAEQRIGRIDARADVEAAVTLIVGTIHGEVLPRVMFAPPGSRVAVPPDLPGRIVHTIMAGIAPRPPGAA